MHIEHPRRRLVSHLSSAVLTFAAATTITSATTHAQPGAAVSSTQPGATVSSTRAGTAASNAQEPQPRPNNEIDRFMERVLAQRDAAPWRRLGDFVLRETYSFELDVPPGTLLSGFRRVREYEWYVRDGAAVRSPVRVDSVHIDDETRRGYERSWLREEARRRDGLDGGDPEPRFITDFFYFLEWGLEPGDYYFVGRESVAGREVIRIEFYPSGPFWEEAGERINRGVIKTSMVTLWIDPEIHQILKYAFENAGLDFLRFRWLLRADGLQASMELAPVSGVWMPARMTLSGRATTALGEFAATVTQEFSDYREAETGVRLLDPRSDR